MAKNKKQGHFVIAYDNRSRNYYPHFDQDYIYVFEQEEYTDKIEKADRFSSAEEAQYEVQSELEHIRQLILEPDGEIIGTRRIWKEHNFKDIPITELTPQEENLIRVFRQSDLQGYHGVIYHPTMLKFTDGIASMTLHSEDDKLIDVIAQVLDWSDAKTRNEYENSRDQYIDKIRQKAHKDYQNHREIINIKLEGE